MSNFILKLKKNTMTNYTEQGINSLKNGDKSNARSLLSRAIKNNPNDEKAWLALAAASEKREQRIYCLKKVLALNPENATAKCEFSKLSSSSKKGNEKITNQNSSKTKRQSGSILKRFINEEQDPGVVQQVYARVSQMR